MLQAFNLILCCVFSGAGNVAKQERVTSLGMDSLLPDVALQQHRLMQQYLDAEAGCHAHLEQVAAVRDKVQSVTSVAEASAALGAEAIQQPGEAKGQGQLLLRVPLSLSSPLHTLPCAAGCDGILLS